MFWLELNDAQKKQYIDAESVFTAARDAEKTAATVRGSMLWRDVKGHTYLIRTHRDNSQTSLGPKSEENEAIYRRFMARKDAVTARLGGLRTAMQTQQRLNRAHRVGRTPQIVVDILNQLHAAGIASHFLTVGTHALFAYESACGVRLVDEATTTQDIDLLMDTQKRLTLSAILGHQHESLLSVLQKVDPTFDLRDDQLYTAVNAGGFEVDVVRRLARDDDPHPLKTSVAERDFWAVQVGNGGHLMSSRRFSQMVVSPSGHMALMQTVHPLDFSHSKEKLSGNPSRDPLKKSRDALQSRAVKALVHEFLPHLEEGESQ
ncbi:GSU2403 family nucleotidyltransferase fold protein [Xylophilus ampelinus]|uniref:Nucleotidyltransferase-like protein n=1 Tax=Xylophilus ampelinus TaxID=54067 RepID=A0A318SIN4_9BURK|nr:GSU2403 family nucleotidyltransferase fold protein [Xylophilus ampelinus]MCS4509777.1 nucleotidyltransferase domain-containing protein [Xylophilus ampelinus]PYE78695.1 nucleotidyltransferase-like protein [Xylophilus ampelinus]